MLPINTLALEEAARLPRACSGLGVAALALLAGFAPVALLCIAARLFR